MKFFNLDEIYKKLNRYYSRGDIFKSHIKKEDIFPIYINLKKITQKDVQNSFSTILKDIKALKSSNLPIVYKEFHFKSIGTQNLPVAIEIKDIEQYLMLIGRQKEYQTFSDKLQKIIPKYPSLEAIILKKPFIVLEYLHEWEKFFKIIDFFVKNKKPNIYIREINLEDIDTKFIEKHKKILDLFLSKILDLTPLNTISDFAFEKRYRVKYPLGQVRFRILDEQLAIQGLKDITLCIDEFEKINIEFEKIFIVENKITFLSFFNYPKSIVIFGNGYGIKMLKNATWMRDRDIYYWGDIDIDGFAILSQIRGYFPQVHSILMDNETVEKFRDRAVKDKNSKQLELKNLTDEENTIFERLKNDFYGKNFRLEQERVAFDFVKVTIAKN